MKEATEKIMKFTDFTAWNVAITIFCDVKKCILIDLNASEEPAVLIFRVVFQLLRLRHQVTRPIECFYLPSRLDGVTSQEAAML
jgi:hypothetical protein